MIFQCEDLNRALRLPELMPDAFAHAQLCEQCSKQLYLWAEISRLAPALREEWESPELWPRIAGDLKPLASGKHGARLWRWAVAAVATAAIAVVLLHSRRPSTAGSREFLTEEALQEVQQAEAAYARSIEKLTRVAGPGLEQSPVPLADAYREKLVLLDSEISDLKANVANNRYNAYLQTQLASLYQEKQKTLQEWITNEKK